jgi:archaellum biogenesis ATPase FlaH
MEYSHDVQKLFLEIILSDAQSFVRVQNIYNAENFDRALRPAAEFISKHSTEHGVLPAHAQVNAVASIDLKPIDSLTDGHLEWFLDEFEKFTRRQELERAILKAADHLEKGEYDPVEKLIKDAVQISLARDMGTDYFADPKGRLQEIRSNNGQMSTGWPSLDHKLFGGFNRGELEIFAGGSGSGKSLIMMNLALNWVSTGKNGVYLTLELDEKLCAMRIDSMVAGVSTREIFRDMDNVDLRIKMMGKKCGDLRIKYMPAQSNVNQFRAYLKELQIQTGMKLDFIMVDYLDLVMPVSVKVNPNDQFIKDKYVAEELRNLAKELGVVLVSASQLNRSAVEEIEFDHSHIAGGISKINTADNVFGIFTSRAMRERGKYQLQLMKTRNSNGIGAKVDLDYNIESLRITDPGLDAQSDSSSSTAAPSEVMAKIKINKGDTSASPLDKPADGKVVGQPNSARLKSMLANLKSNA